jgi:Resolvase, N terminal domain
MNAAARVSSDIQRQERTIESQVFELRKQIARAGHVLVKEYVDDGHSGAELDRPKRNNETVYCILRGLLGANTDDDVVRIDASKHLRLRVVPPR